MMICLLVLVFVAFGFFRQTSAHSSHSYAELRDLILSEQVNEIVCDEDSVTLNLKKPLDTGETQVTFPLYSFQLFYQDFNQVLQEQKDAGVLKDYDYPDKPSRRTTPIKADYVGFSIPDAYVVGFGLDFDQDYRQLPYVGVLKPEIYE